MKTAVSLPDEIFRQAEVTERLNQVYSKYKSKLDPWQERAMLQTLDKDRWQ